MKNNNFSWLRKWWEDFTAPPKGLQGLYKALQPLPESGWFEDFYKNIIIQDPDAKINFTSVKVEKTEQSSTQTRQRLKCSGTLQGDVSSDDKEFYLELSVPIDGIGDDLFVGFGVDRRAPNTYIVSRSEFFQTGIIKVPAFGEFVFTTLVKKS